LRKSFERMWDVESKSKILFWKTLHLSLRLSGHSSSSTFVIISSLDFSYFLYEKSSSLSREKYQEKFQLWCKKKKYMSCSFMNIFILLNPVLEYKCNPLQLSARQWIYFDYCNFKTSCYMGLATSKLMAVSLHMLNFFSPDVLCTDIAPVVKGYMIFPWVRHPHRCDHIWKHKSSLQAYSSTWNSFNILHNHFEWESNPSL